MSNDAVWGAGIDSGMRLYVIDSVVADNQGTFGGSGAVDGGLPAWIPRSSSAPSVDSGNPAGATYDNDADPSTSEVPLAKDQWNDDRPFDGDGDGTPRTDIGAIEFHGLFFDTFESGDACYWSDSTGGPACP